MLKMFLFLFLSLSVYAMDLGEIDVSTDVDKDVKQSIANDVFEEVEYIESNSYMPKAAGQKRLTTEEALFIPGTQGDPLKALQFIGGISSTGGSFSGELYIYGSKPEESSYNLNHLPIGYLFHMGGIHSVVDPNAIEQIDAYLAGFDSTYGDAMGGVIDISPKYPTDEFSGYGHVGIFDASAGVNVALGDDTSFYLGARRSYFDLGYELVGSPQPDDSNNTIIQFPAYYDITFLFSQNMGDEDLLSIEILSAADKLKMNIADNAKEPKATGNVGIKTGFTSAGVRWSRDVGNYSSNTLAYYSYVYSDIELFTDYYLKNESNVYGLFHESTLEYDKHKVVFGFEGTRSIIPLDMNIMKPPSEENPKPDFDEVYNIHENIKTDKYELFIQDVYSLNDELKFRIGTRLGYSDYNDFGSYIDPRLSAVYTPNESHSASFSVGKYTQSPEGFKTIEQMGNTDIRYQSAMHYVLHYDYKMSKDATFSIEPFYKNYDSLAVDDASKNYDDTGDGYAYGVDSSIKYKDGKWYAFAAYTYLRSKRDISTTSGLKDFYAEIPQTLQFVGARRFGKNWVLSALMKYTSGALYTPVVSSYDDNGTTRPIYGDEYSERLSPYFTLNLKIAQTIKYANKTSLEWSFELMNATNHKNVTGITYDDDYNEDGETVDLPILPWFDVTYRF